MNFVIHLLFYMKLLNYLFCDMFGGVLECYELTHRLSIYENMDYFQIMLFIVTC